MERPVVKSFLDKSTCTVTHVVSMGKGTSCAIVDPVLDFDYAAGKTSTTSADLIIDYIQSHNLTVEYILETHVHADHLTASPYLQEKLSGKIGIGSRITEVQDVFKSTFNAGEGFFTDGRQFNRLFKDGEQFSIGRMEINVMHTPGHTPACVTYVFNGTDAFVGDTLFMPDFGTARCDFPGGDAKTLYRSIKQILSMSDQTRLYMCHDYAPNGRGYQWVSTVAEQRSDNIHVHDDVTEEAFVTLRTERDKTLSMPTLILPSVQVNMRGGHFPPAEDNGTTYLKIPVGE